MSISELNAKIAELENEANYLFDLFTRAAHSKSGSILEKLCKVRAEQAKLKKERRELKQAQKK